MEFLITHFKEFLITLSKKFLVINSKKFLVTNSAEKPEKMSTTFVEILGISREKFFRTYSWEFPGNFSQDFLKSSSGISWHILGIFLSIFTNQDLDPIVVYILTTIFIAPHTFYKHYILSITYWLSYNVIVFYFIMYF